MTKEYERKQSSLVKEVVGIAGGLPALLNDSSVLIYCIDSLILPRTRDPQQRPRARRCRRQVTPPPHCPPALADPLRTSLATSALNAPIAYIKPTVTERGEGSLDLSEARHPCLEVMEGVNFIANDVKLERGESTRLKDE